MHFFDLIQTAHAQSPPENGRAIQRTIIDEQELMPVDVHPAKTQANNTVLFGLAAVVLVVIALGLAMVFWGPKVGKQQTPKK